MYLKQVIFVYHIVSFGYCANILAIVPTPSISHQLHYFDFWKELSLRGHNVTVITTDPQRNEKLTNLTEIDMKWTYKFYSSLSSNVMDKMNSWNFHYYFHNATIAMMEEELAHYKIQDLIHNKDNHFDVLFVEWFGLEFLGFSEIQKCPTIVISSLDVYLNIHYKFGNTAHPALYPNLGSSLLAPLDFAERVTSSVYNLCTWFFYRYFSYARRSEVMQKYFNTTTTIDDLLGAVDMLFVNTSPVLLPIRAVGPDTITIDGIRQMSYQPLPMELQQYLDSATDGFVYFSLGSNVKSKDLSEKSLNAIIESLGELPCKVLWKFEAEPDAIPNKPDNVKLIKWAPQLGILAHRNIKVFITQGGLQSIEETIHNEVPCVVIPFFADQEQNAKLMERKGFATTVHRHPHIKKEDLKSAILEVLNNPKYKSAVRELKRLVSDTPMTGLEKAIWWTEYVIRNKGAKHLRNPAADLPLYQYFLLDVIGFVLAVAAVVLTVSYILLRKIYSLIRTIILNSPVETKKKLQ